MNFPYRVLIYGAGQAINGTASLEQQIRSQLGSLSAVATNRFVAALAQLNSTDIQSLRWILDPSKRFPYEWMPDFNTGDPDELLLFAQWAISQCPADQTILVLSGHGMAWEDSTVEDIVSRLPSPRLPMFRRPPGSLPHRRRIATHSLRQMVTKAILIDGSNLDYLSNVELGLACHDISHIMRQKIGVLVLDACLMSSWEVLFELQDSVLNVVAAVDELSARGIDLTRPIQSLTDSSGLKHPNEVARDIAALFIPAADFDTCIAINLSSTAWRVAFERFRSFSHKLRNWTSIAGNASLLRGAFFDSTDSIVKYQGGNVSDIGRVLESVSKIPSMNSECVEEMRHAIEMINSCILGRTLGASYSNSIGLSLFTPVRKETFRNNRRDYAKLPFAIMSGWLDLLDTLYE